MQVYKIFRNQKIEASQLISAALGALVLNETKFIHNTAHSIKSDMVSRIWDIFTYCELVFAQATKGQTHELSKQTVIDLLKRPNIANVLLANVELNEMQSTEDLHASLSNGLLLQVTVAGHTMAFGKTADTYWRLDTAYTADASALILYKDYAELQQALNHFKDSAPEFTFLKVEPLKLTQKCKL